MNYNEIPWRVGNKTRRTIYALVPGVEYDKHPLLGMMDTDVLAAEVVTSHNQGLIKSTFAQKEQLIKDLQRIQEMMEADDSVKLEDAILSITTNKARSQYIYTAYGNSAEMLQNMDVSAVVPHAIYLVRNQ
jgi:hypothetical protein